jgi:fatty acid desaturase
MVNQTHDALDPKPLWPMVVVGIDFGAILVCAIVGHLSVGSGKLEELKSSESIMEDTNGVAQAIDPTKKAIPTPARELLKRPSVAYPTVLLLLCSYAIYGTSFVGYVTGNLFWWQSFVMSTLALYWSFTVMHDAVHMAIAPRNRWLNDGCGWLASLLLFAPFPLFRFIHLSHHRYSGDDALDPDAYAGHGPEVLLPFRWATIIHNYIFYFSRTVCDTKWKVDEY